MRWILTFLLASSFFGVVSADEPRLALVLGNEAYPPEVGQLAEPHEDAALVAAALEDMGFEIVGGVRSDASRDETWAAILEFQQALINAGGDAVGFFYYSGHGGSFESQGKRLNYLIPANSPILSANQLPALGVSLNDVMTTLEAADAKAVFIVSDACRNTLPWTTHRGGAQPDRGFSAQKAIKGMLLAYSTADGDTAPDDGRFARSLAKHIKVPGITVDRMFTFVAREVSLGRAGGERPVISDRLSEDFCFNGCPGAAASMPPQNAAWDPEAGLQEAQKILNTMGYDAGAENGLLSEKTLTALTQLKAATGVGEGDRVDRKTLLALRLLRDVGHRAVVSAGDDAVEQRVARWFYDGTRKQAYGTYSRIWEGWVTANHFLAQTENNRPDFVTGDLVAAPGGLDIALYGTTLPPEPPSGVKEDSNVTVIGFPAGSRQAELREGTVYKRRPNDDVWIARIYSPSEPVVVGMSGALVFDSDSNEPIGIVVDRNSVADLDRDGGRDQSFDFVALEDVYWAMRADSE